MNFDRKYWLRVRAKIISQNSRSDLDSAEGFYLGRHYLYFAQLFLKQKIDFSFLSCRAHRAHRVQERNPENEVIDMMHLSFRGLWV